MRRTLHAVTAAAVALATMMVAYGVDARTRPGPQPLGPGEVTIKIDIDHSAFTPSAVDVVAGTKVRFVLDNNDPINHEFILGPPAVHDRHRNGTEAEHPPVPGEVSLPPGTRALTTYRFRGAGTVEFVCHLPGHENYGMRGAVTVHPAQR